MGENSSTTNKQTKKNDIAQLDTPLTVIPIHFQSFFSCSHACNKSLFVVQFFFVCSSRSRSCFECLFYGCFWIFLFGNGSLLQRSTANITFKYKRTHMNIANISRNNIFGSQKINRCYHCKHVKMFDFSMKIVGWKLNVKAVKRDTGKGIVGH